MTILDLAREKQEKYRNHFNKYIRPMVEDYVKITGSKFLLEIGDIRLEFDGSWWIINVEPAYDPIVCDDLEKDIQDCNIISRTFCKYEHDVYQYITGQVKRL